MAFTLYDYVNEGGKNEFKAWCENLQTKHRAKLNQKLDALIQYGDGLHPHMLTDTNVPGIKKLRVQGNVKLRPLLCNGPVLVKSEYTLLMGAKEIGDKWSPKKAPESALVKKEAVIADPAKRRKKHERVT